MFTEIKNKRKKIGLTIHEVVLSFNQEPPKDIQTTVVNWSRYENGKVAVRLDFFRKAQLVLNKLILAKIKELTKNKKK